MYIYMFLVYWLPDLQLVYVYIYVPRILATRSSTRVCIYIYIYIPRILATISSTNKVVRKTSLVLFVRAGALLTEL